MSDAGEGPTREELFALEEQARFINDHLDELMKSTREAWVAKPGETVLLRFTKPIDAESINFVSDYLKTLTRETGVHFVLLSSDVEVVNPRTGESYGPAEEAFPERQG